MTETRESAVGRLLRDAGVTKYARQREPGLIGIREAERRTGVSRQTLSVWLRDLEGGERRRYDAASLDLVAQGLGINRRALGIAAMQDSGHVLAGGSAHLENLYEYLAERSDAEKVQILKWLAERIATADADDEIED